LALPACLGGDLFEINYQSSVPETQNLDTFLPRDTINGAVFARDIASTDKADVRILAGDPNGTFEFDDVTDNLVLIRPLDFETQPEHVLQLQASLRQGNVTITKNAQYTVTVLNRNEHSPVFNQSVYMGSIVEDAINGTAVVLSNGPVVVTDADTGLDGTLRLRCVTDQ
jgi:hypothetical protein